DVEGLRRALKTAILSHPMLSARLSEKEDGSVVISSGDPVGVTVTELSQKEFDEMKSSLVRPFGLFDGPLARFEIYRTEAGVYLFEDVHHIVFDGTSMALLAASVGAAIDGKQPENEISSAFDEAEKEQTVLSSDEAKHAEKYWDDLLEGVSSICEPESDVRSSETEQRWLKKEIGISEAAFSKMRHKIGFSTSALFTAAFSYALSVFSAASDVAFNTVCSGRDEHNANVVGMFVKTFPFRLKMDQSASVADLLREATAQLSSSRNNSFYPYIRLAEKFCLKPVTEFAYQADRSFNPLVKGLNVEVERIYDKAHIESAALHGEVTRDASGRYVFLLGYHADRYSDDWAKNFADVFDKIVSEFLVKSTLCDVQLIPDGTKALLDGFNKTEVPRDGADIVTMFRRCAKKYKDKPCVVAGDKTYTFFQADALTDALAAELERRGIGRGSVVSVLVPRNEFMAIVSLGVLKSGAAYQPLDPSYPEERLRFMTENAHACAIIADRALVGKLGDVTVPVIFTDSVASLPTAGPVDAKISPDDAFVLLYTSGTTGTPKGAIITHSNVSELAKWSHDYFAMDENVRYGAYASYGFDAHLAELYPTLTCGGTLYIVPDDIRLELTAIEEFFNKNEITHSQMTTQVGRQFAMHYKGGKLKDLMVGGEVLVPIEPEKINFKLHNAYGPSECTVLCAIQPVDKLYHRIPIGRPLDNVKVYIVDKNLKLLPPFAPGELLIAGPRVAKGYLGLPEKTAAAFISNPFTDEKGYERAYRSGDVVRMLSDGRLDFIGRNDGQVKVRGFRIELSEVEAVIRQFEGIADATVQAFADEHTGMKYLAAYVVSDRPVDVAALNDFIKSKKPPYMVPSVTMQIDRIPLTANQKVDKRALPLLKRQAAEHVMPETAEEKLAFDCACEALGHSDVGVTDDLYEAGLTSLNVMRLIVLLSDAFGKTVRMSDVRQHPTVRQLAAFASRKESENDKKTEKLYPLSGVQQGVYVECLANPDTTIYNIPLLLKLDRSTDIDALERALTAVVDAHPYLKARLKTDATGETFVVRDDAKKIKL
ncbi:MAG: amino acid adenylation domain-containing protein, partial [Clostridia bacterium]|nr:amino acid adenylation domain-containing protein [Clostridia bacterium]